MKESRRNSTPDLRAGQAARGVVAITPTCAERVTTGLCQICETNEIGTWRWDLNADLLQGSERTRSIAGLGDGPERRDVFLTRIASADRERVERRLAAVAAQPGTFQVEFGVVIGSELRTVRMQGHRDLETSESAPQIFGTMEDITARLQTADALMELSLAVEQARDFVCIASASGTIEYLNPAWRDKLGSERTLAGMPAAVLIGDPQIWSEGRSEVDRMGMFRRTLKKTNGRVTYEEITMWPVRDVRGDVARIVLICSDVTDKKIAGDANAHLQDVLRKAANEWRQTLDAIDAAVVMFDPPATIRRMNQAARDLLGRREFDLVGCDLAASDLSEPWPSALQLVSQAAENGLSCQADVRDPQSGKTWNVIANVSLHEEVRDVVVIIRDMTETIAMQESLRRTETLSAMGNLVAGVAHEVRNPLFGMTATLDAMELKFSGNSETLRYTSVIRQELGRLQTLMRDLLDYGRAARLDLAPIVLGSVVVSAVNLCRESAAVKGVTISNEVPATFGACRADSLRLEQVLRNLLDNAISFSRSGDTVTVTAGEMDGPRGKWYSIETRDHGPGFAAADLPHVFEPFFTRRKNGTGLGLPIVQRMVEEHGGRVTAANAEGGGAVVRIELPAGVR